MKRELFSNSYPNSSSFQVSSELSKLESRSYSSMLNKKAKKKKKDKSKTPVTVTATTTTAAARSRGKRVETEQQTNTAS